MDNEFKLFIIFHKYLLDNCYIIDPELELDNLIFIKCNELFKPTYNKNFGYNIIYEKDFKIYNPKLQDINKPYMAISAIYHIYKNKIYNNLKYIGFLEYDLSFEPETCLLNNNKQDLEIQKLKNIKSITSEIKQQFLKNDKIILILSGRHRFKSFYNENNMINNINLYEKIIIDYNKFYNTNHTLDKLFNENPVLGDQQSFLADINTFEKIMEFISFIIENKYVEIDGFRPSFLLARYIGVTLYLFDVPKKLIMLI